MDIISSLDSWEYDDDESEEEEEQREFMIRQYQLVHSELMASYGSDKSTTSHRSNKRKRATQKRKFILTSEDTRNTAMVEQTPWNNLWHIEYVLNWDCIDKD